MKREVLKFSLGLTFVCMLASCAKETDPSYASYGVIQNRQSPDRYEILTDMGNTLKVTKSYASMEIADGKRVLANFNLLSEKEKSRNIYEVEVNGFYNLLSKPLVAESFILQDGESRRDSIGNDPYNAIQGWLGGGYLNINFELYYAPYSGIKHFINLIYDDTRADADTIYLTFSHNAYGETPDKTHSLYRGVGRCSFKISDLQRDDDGAGRPYKLTWSQYTHGYESREYSAVYTPVQERDLSASFKAHASGGLYDNQIKIE